MKCKYVIIGNSSSGIGATEAIRSADKEGSLAIISDEPIHTYSRALIPYYLKGKIDRDKLYFRPLDFYEKKNVKTFLGNKVVDVNTDNKTITLNNGEKIQYEKLLIASGGEPFVPPINGLSNNYYTFTSLEDADKIKEKIQSGDIKEVVVLGGGLIGLLVAEALNYLGMNVTVVELADRILVRVLDKTASEIFTKLIEVNGITLITGRTISEVKGETADASKVEKVILDNGDTLNCDMLVIAIGVRPRVDFLSNTQIKINRGIVVNNQMKTNIPDVYACGDCAEIYDFVYETSKLTPIWPAAYIGGMVAGFNMCGIEKEFNTGMNMNSMKFFGLPVMSAGLIERPEDDKYEELIRYEKENKIYKKIILKDNLIKGLIIVNSIDNIGIILGLLRNQIDVSSFKDQLISDDFDLVYFPQELRKDLIIGGLK
ncbi:MAG: NAD(P)/FAD-dependent oxidoreductase [Candidatus Helarchaeota archaeon]